MLTLGLPLTCIAWVGILGNRLWKGIKNVKVTFLTAKIIFFLNLSQHTQAICVFCHLKLSQSLNDKELKIIVQQNLHLKLCRTLHIGNKGRNDQSNPPPINGLDNISTTILWGVLIKSKNPAYFNFAPQGWSWIPRNYCGVLRFRL